MKSFKQYLTESDTNSTGRPIYQTPEGIANFWKWFGDSKIVDTQGRPLVVFHTSVADFNRFKRDPRDIGIHFGTEGQAADRYHHKLDKDPYGPTLRDVKHNTIPVYLRITNPLRLNDLGSWSPIQLSMALQRLSEFKSDVAWSKPILGYQKLIISKGYDGIVYRNINENGGGEAHRRNKAEAFRNMIAAIPDYSRKKGIDSEYHNHPAVIAYEQAFDDDREYRDATASDSWIVFNPKQIKSAIGNNGNFKSTSAIITESE